MNRFIGAKYGAIAGGITSVWMIYLFSSKIVISPIGRLSMLLVPLLLFGGILSSMYFQRKLQDGKLIFIDAFKSGLLAAATYSIIMAIITFICQTIIYPEFTIDAIANAKAKAIAEKFDPKKMNEILQKMKVDIEIGSQVTKTIFGGLLTGTIFSLLCAGLMRRQ